MLTGPIVACRQKSTSVQLALSKDSQSVTVTGLSETELNGITRDSMPMEAWQALLAVTRADTTDTATFNPIIDGRYSIANHLIIFTPNAAFKKELRYKARFYLLNDDSGPLDMILKHRQLGQPGYIELKF